MNEIACHTSGKPSSHLFQHLNLSMAYVIFNKSSSNFCNTFAAKQVPTHAPLVFSSHFCFLLLVFYQLCPTVEIHIITAHWYQSYELNHVRLTLSTVTGLVNEAVLKVLIQLCLSNVCSYLKCFATHVHHHTQTEEQTQSSESL